MAFKNGLSDHLDELRLASPRSPPSDSGFSSFPSPPGTQPGFASAFQSPVNNDTRSNMQRRFTTDSARFSSWTGFTPQAPPLPESVDFLSSATQLHKSQIFEKKRQHIEYMREQKKRFETDLKLLDLQQEKERKEMDQIARDLAQTGLNGPVSEPTTPPEYREAGFPTAFSRPPRFSISSTTPSSSLFSNIMSSHGTTPASGQLKSTVGSTSNTGSTTEAAMNSRRNSEHDNNSAQFPARRPGHSVRYSLPTSNIGPALNGAASNNHGFTNTMGLGSFFSAKHLLGEDEDDKPKDEDRMSTPDVKSYLRMTDPDDKFPTLIRRDENPGVLSANPAAIDLANSRTPVPETYGATIRQHSAHQSLPQNTSGLFHSDNSVDKSGAISSAATSAGYPATRHITSQSLEGNLQGFGNNQQAVPQSTSGAPHSRPTSLHLSYSTNDIPTARNNGGFQGAITPPKTRDEQTQHGHNMITAYAPQTPNSSHSHNSTTPPTPQSADQESQFVQPVLQNGFSNSVSFPPQVTSVTTHANGNEPGSSLNSFQPNFYGYGAQQFTGAPLQVNGNQGQPFTPHSSFGPYGSQAYGAYPRFTEGSRGTGQGRRNGETDTSPFSRFSNVPLENYQGELYGLCKDQHGCRYLQRKLEERTPENVQMIFRETNMHVVELMTDPFGNYLCQKLLEFSNDEQRTTLISNAAPHLVQIAFNQHGTRALQKMIEFISTSEQTQMVIDSLRDNVVELVQDLNGNHVIQKCLNRLSASDAQFIYDSVGTSCVVVGTHRHGCCVLQRCIDHASGEQRARLIAQITANAFALVQDPFGNYVVQYILDLSEPHFTEPLCQTFRGNVPGLSKQKFSSNVIEKCIRTAEFQVRRLLVQEMMAPNELERMLRDSFANYVVQTAIDFADPETRNTLMDAVRPILPAIRQTPHGRRIAGKMVSLDAQNRANGAATNGQLTPNGLVSDENGMYPSGRSFPSAPSQFAPQFNFPENMMKKPPVTTSADSTSTTVNADDAATVIYSPIPQHGNHAINGINGVNGTNFSFF